MNNPIFGRLYENKGFQFEIADDFSTVTIKDIERHSNIVCVPTSTLVNLYFILESQTDVGTTPEVEWQRFCNMLPTTGREPVLPNLSEDEIAKIPEEIRPVFINNCEARYDNKVGVWNLYNPWGRWLGHVTLKEQAIQSLESRKEYASVPGS